MTFIDHQTLDDLSVRTLFSHIASLAQTQRAKSRLLDEPFLESFEQLYDCLEAAKLLAALQAKNVEWFVLPKGIEEVETLEHEQGLISPSFILRVRGILEVLERTRTIGRAVWLDCEPLFSLCAKLTHFDTLSKLLDEAFDHQGMVRPDASMELLELAYELTQVRKQTESLFENALHDPKIQNFLQDRYITLRNGRFVLPIKEEMMGKFRGIIQDVSKSEHTVFMEPLALIRHNNLFRQRCIEYDQALEIFRKELQEKILGEMPNLSANVEILTKIDTLVAKAKFLRKLDAKSPKLTTMPPSKVQGLAHPLLILQGLKPIPHDFELEPGKLGLILTGPNGGGKTVFLTSIGLNLLLVKRGLLPCVKESSVLLIPRGIYAAMAEGESLAEGLSSFTGYLTRLKTILERVEPGDFVLMDEPLRNTDPLEGSLLLQAILEALFEKGVFVFIATHNPWMKSWAKTHPSCSVYTLEFDPKTQTPTYHLKRGEVSESFALDAARNVGFPEAILKKALELKACDPYLSLKDQLQEEKRKLEEERGRVQALLKGFENRLDEVLAQAEQKKTVGSRASGTLKEAVRREALQTFKAISPERVVPEAFMPSTLLIGDRVRIEGMKAEGVVAALNQERRQADVLLGELKLRLPIESLHPLPKAGPKPKVTVHLQEAGGDSEGLLDVRGMDTESALGLIERQISRALTKGKGSVKILHGIGALRRHLREAIQENYRGIALVRPGHDLEGGEAFSIVELR